MWKLRKSIVPGLCLVLCLGLSSCGKEEEAPEPPAAYEVGGDSVPSLNETVGEESGTLSAVVSPDADVPGDGDAAPAVEPVYTYTYTALEAAGQAVSNYVTALTGEDQGFQVVDDQEKVTEAPAFDTEEGSVSLAKSSAEEGRIMQLDIAWTVDGCTVAVSQPEGAVQEEAPPEEAAPKSITAADAVGFLEGLSPEVLGLEGSSMKTYKVYYLDGEVMVNNLPCACLRVYSTSGQGENVFEGTYMVTGDKQHLYRMASSGTTVEELPLTQATQANLKKG